MLAFEEARTRLLAIARPLGCERVALDLADGRVLHEDVVSDVDLPAADMSAMDGYAVRARDLTVDAPTELDVVGEARPGMAASETRAGTAARIFTGAIVPSEFDAVIPQEDVVKSENRIRIERSVRAGANIRRRGEDLARGAAALSRGTRITPTKLGLLATLDRAWVVVGRRPVVTVISTGDELRLPGSPSEPAQIAESGSITVSAMARRAGAIAAVHPMVPDDPERTEAALESALRTSDVVVTIGGMSVGEHDLVRPALTKIGAALDFWKVSIKPGKPLGVGTRGDAIVLGLPGNPAAAVVTFALFGVPLLRTLEGDTAPIPQPLRARCGVATKHKPGRLEFVRATVRRHAGELVVFPLANQSSGSVPSVAHADGLVAIPSETSNVAEGASVDFYSFSDFGA